MVNMDRHKCKLCSRRFSSGRALGGHMRSHLATLPLPPQKQKQKQKQNQMLEEVNYSDFVDVGTDTGGGGGGDGDGGGNIETYTESTSSECFEEEQEAKADETESEVEKGLVYGLRENPKKSFRLVDPEFLDDPSVVQDRESETESTRKPTRRRSKRTRRMLAAKVVDHVVVVGDDDDDDAVVKKVQDMINNKPSSAESLVVELEPVSSVSDTSPEEDLALCLIMLSRDVWSSSTTFSDNSEVLKLSQTHNTKFKFRCEICNRVFASSQALGSHRTSHTNKKIKMNFSPTENNNNNHEVESKQQQQQFIKSNNNGVIKNAEKKVHECPFCGKVFGSGQALGGHKRSHLMSSSTTTTNTTTPSSSSKPGDSLVDSNSAKIQEALMIDLNLPAPMEEEEDQDGGFFCLQEVSALSDSVFINPIKH